MTCTYCFTNYVASKAVCLSLLLAAGLVACAAGGPRPQAGPASSPAAAQEPPATAPTSPEVMARVWAAEAAGAEGNLELAAQEYLAASFTSDDPAIARRATEVAISAQSWHLAGMAADRWVLLDPQSVEARKTAARALLVSGDYVQAEFQLSGLLGLLAAEPWNGWPEVAQLLTAGQNAERIDRLLEHLVPAQGAEDNPYALLARSQAAARGGDVALARKLAGQALERGPAEVQLHIWAGRLARTARDPEAALEHYRDAWRLAPGNREHALALAELLRQGGQGAEANEVLSTLPDTPENRFVRIAIAVQTDRPDLAEDLYAGFTTMPYADRQAVALHAARAAELLGRTAEAIDWYAQLQDSDQALAANLRRAALTAELGDIDGARTILRQAANGQNANVRTEAVLVEAQILAGAGRQAEAMTVLDAALESEPDESRLLYSRALLAVELDDIDQAEADLRRLLDADPTNPTALNALGYTLADRTQRLDEAEELIRAAYELDPNQAAIIDSMGWVAYRLGRLEEAETYLRQAFLMERNAEIAAHLGEVLWVQDRRRDAIAVWAEGLKIDPDDRVLVETLNRLGISL